MNPCVSKCSVDRSHYFTHFEMQTLPQTLVQRFKNIVLLTRQNLGVSNCSVPNINQKKMYGIK